MRAFATVLRRLIGIGAACAIGLILAESLLRLTMQMSWSSPLFVPDPEVGFRMRAGVAFNGGVTNSRGYNDVDHAEPKAPDVVRIAVVGDSFVFGVVPRALNSTAVMQRLATASGARVEVLNMGLPAAGPRNYAGIIRADAVDAKADLVVVILFMGNDIAEAHPDFATRVWLGDAREVLVRPWTVGPSLDYVTIYRLGRGVARTVHERWVAHDGALSQTTFEDVEWQRARVFRKSPSVFVRAAYGGLIDTVHAMQSITQEHRIRLVAVLAPDEIQVEPSLQDETLRRFGADRGDYDFDALSGRLARELVAAGIPVLDLLPVLKRAAVSESLYALRDTHWNAAGNQVAGQAMWEFVRALLPDGSAAANERQPGKPK